jgi:glutamate synthase (NADPH/NADH) large chain
MATLGFRTVEEMVGRVEMLRLKSHIPHWKYKHLDLTPILYKQPAETWVGTSKRIEQDHGIADVLDRRLIHVAEPALEQGQGISSTFEIRNTDRATGTMLSHEVSKRYGSQGLPDGTIQFRFRGSAGQSFGAFGARGLHFILEGESNDYFGKGLSGARLIVVPDRAAKFDPAQNIIIGNVALYGATSGEAYIMGMAGERFAVRNSGAIAVIEGLGDHGCEYMTGGTVVVLGETGKNFAAGMSGGVAFVYNPKGTFERRVNAEMVDLDPLDATDYEQLITLIRRHFHYTGSNTALQMLNKWTAIQSYFIKVMPRDYKAVLLKKQSQVVEHQEGVLRG